MLLLDTYNILHAWAAIGGGVDEPDHKTSAGPAALARLIARSRFRTHAIRLICDGSKPRGTDTQHMPTNCEIRYAGPGVEADTLIERLLERDTAPSRLTVVSSDRRIRAAAKRHGAKALASDRFLAGVIRDASHAPRPSSKPAFAREVPLKRAALEMWLSEFGITPDSSLAKIPASKSGARSRKKPGKSTKRPPPQPQAPPAPRPIDPELRKLIEGSGTGIDPDELDTGKWLGGG